MLGKEKCKQLKEIRRQIAEKNDIEFVTSNCTHQGDCKGTCPKCEAEVKYLERELALRKSIGKAVSVVGISVGLCSTLTACSPVDSLKTVILPNIEHQDEELDGETEIQGTEDLAGDIAPIPQDEIEGVMVAPDELDMDMSGEVPDEY